MEAVSIIIERPSLTALRDRLFQYDGSDAITPEPVIICLAPIAFMRIVYLDQFSGSALPRLEGVHEDLAKTQRVELPVVAVRISPWRPVTFEVLDGQHRTASYALMRCLSAPYLTERRMADRLLGSCGAPTGVARERFDFSLVEDLLVTFP
jgi:hypothetical protein